MDYLMDEHGQPRMPTAREVALRLGGAVDCHPLPEPLAALKDLVWKLSTLEQTCDDCALGVHPPLMRGAWGILNSLGWLLARSADGTHLGGPQDGTFVDGGAIRTSAKAAIPAFAHLWEWAMDSMPDELTAAHPELRELATYLTKS